MSLHKVFPGLFSGPVIKERERAVFHPGQLNFPSWVCSGWPLLLSQEEHERITREKPWLLTRASPEALPGTALTKEFGPLDRNGKRVHEFYGTYDWSERYIPTLALEYIFRSAIPEVKAIDITEFSQSELPKHSSGWFPRVLGEGGQRMVDFERPDTDADFMAIMFHVVNSDVESYQEIPRKLFDHIESRLDQIEKYLDDREKHKGDPSYKDPFPVQGPRAPYVPSGCKIDHGIGCTIVDLGERCEAWYNRKAYDLFSEEGLRAKAEIASSDLWKQSGWTRFLPNIKAQSKEMLSDVAALVVGATEMCLTVEKRDGDYCLIGMFKGAEIKIQFAPGNGEVPLGDDAWDRIVINPNNEVTVELAKSIIEHYEMAIEAPYQADQQKAKKVDRLI